MATESKLFDGLLSAIKNEPGISEEIKAKLLKQFMANDRKVNLMITGATGSGKSSTINALFGGDVAKVGTTPDPQTMDIRAYKLENMTLWDSPGLGDGRKSDNEYARQITKKLLDRDENGDMLIDLVLVIMDGGSRDLGTSYQLINEVIIPNLGEGQVQTSACRYQ